MGAKRGKGEGGPTTSVEVTIGGRGYRLRGQDPEALRELAREVDRTLAELAGPGRKPDDFKLAVLTALNIAGEGRERRAECVDEVAELRRRSTTLAERIEGLRARASSVLR